MTSLLLFFFSSFLLFFFFLFFYTLLILLILLCFCVASAFASACFRVYFAFAFAFALCKFLFGGVRSVPVVSLQHIGNHIGSAGDHRIGVEHFMRSEVVRFDVPHLDGRAHARGLVQLSHVCVCVFGGGVGGKEWLNEGQKDERKGERGERGERKGFSKPR